jgi:hypothetical protein
MGRRVIGIDRFESWLPPYPCPVIRPWMFNEWRDAVNGNRGRPQETITDNDSKMI